jgi:hypothetical protein
LDMRMKEGLKLSIPPVMIADVTKSVLIFRF